METGKLLDRVGNAVPEDRIAEFAGKIGASLIRPGDTSYESARQIWNELVQKHPGAVLKCRGTSDVVAAVNFARDNNVLVSVRGGGHNVGGRALCDGGLVIDLSAMRAIHVDPGAKTVRAQGGATLGDVDRESHVHGLAVPLGVVSKTGIGGLTLGGGVGWLVRKYGPSCDNVIEMEVVTADGKVRAVNAKDNAELFWSLRGGGGNFGVVTSFLFQAYPVATVLGGLIIYPREAASTVLRKYRDFMALAPEDLTVYAGLICTPDGTPVTAVIPCWSGIDMKAGEKAIAPLKSFAEPMMVQVGEMPFPAMQSMLDAAFPSGTRNYWKSAFVKGLPDGAIDVLTEHAKGLEQSPMSGLLVEYYGGAGGRKPIDENAFAQREPDYCIGFMPQWTDAQQDDQHIAWARKASDAIQPFATGGYLLNYLSDGEQDAVRAAFGKNYDRLREMKRKFDPSNFFSVNHNIQPAA